MPAYESMSFPEAQQLADRLAEHGGRGSIVQYIANIEAECRLASRLIQAMLRQVHGSDTFLLPPEE